MSDDVVQRMADELPARLAALGSDVRELVVCAVDDDEGLVQGEGPTAWIMEISSRSPRSGHGRAMMAEVCLLADETGCSIALNPWAQMGAHPDALRQDELEAFYQSFGFGWRRDHVMVRRPWVQTVVDVRHDVAYLPRPNRVELVLSGTCSPSSLTRTSFVLPITDDGTVVMANNRRRGVEVPGGHIDPGETAEQAARREGREEVGVGLGRLVPLGHLRMRSSGIAPPGWSYPHPLSYQQFFAARVERIEPYQANDECVDPVLVSDLSVLKPHVRLMARRARVLLTQHGM